MRDIFMKFRRRRAPHSPHGSSSKSGTVRLFGRTVQKKTLWRGVKIGGAAAVLLVAGLFAWYSKDLPTPGKIRKRQAAQSTKILDRDGELLFEIHGEEKRTVLKSDDIPEIAKQATLTAEDRNFYNHFGVDFRGLARAIVLDVFTGSRVGGSTITQQYVKNALLTNQKTFDRKIKELILALEIEAMLSKEEILTLYLNEIPYGSNNYGIQSASQAFFGKDAKDLELHEAAMLAALPQLPTYYSPYGTHTDELKARRDWILNSMAELGHITQEEADAAIAKEIAVQPRSSDIKAPHFVFYVQEQLVEMFGEQLVEEGGLTVHTTLDLELQQEAEAAVQAGIDRVRARGGSNAALVSLDPKTGEVMAMVGSVDYFDTESDGNVNVTVSDRQPGSSFKPIVYATGFKEGRNFNPASTLWDVPTDFGNYEPKNYDGSFRGPISIRSALATSLNIPAVKMLGLVGLEAALETAHDLGITTLNEPERYGLALVLGGGEVKPIDMATAFSTFANGGTYKPQVSILKVEAPGGEILHEHETGKGERDVLAPEIAWQISDILSDNNARSPVFGSRSALYFGERPVAAKTGTTNEFRDAWTVGYTPSIATAVWAGNNDNSPMRNADGSVIAAPIFHDYMERALAGSDIEPFTRPDTVKSVTVDKLSNKLPTDSSPETITDWFAPWQIPTTRDDIHVKAKVNKLNGKLATEFTPESVTEERVYTVIRSEMPEKPNWENPVIAWAESQGIAVGRPPTETDDMYTADTIPAVTISSPSDGATIDGAATVSGTASAGLGVKIVELFIGNEQKASSDNGSFSFALSSSDLGVGTRTITVRVIDVNDASASQTISVTVNPDQDPPGSVTNLSATGQNKQVKLTWKNPNDTDLARVRVYVSEEEDELGTKYGTEVVAKPGQITTFTVTGLNNFTTYYFTVRPVDTTGNENKSTKQVEATPSPL